MKGGFSASNSSQNKIILQETKFQENEDYLERWMSIHIWVCGF